MIMEDKEKPQETSTPEKVGLGHARMHQKGLEKAKKIWRGKDK